MRARSNSRSVGVLLLSTAVEHQQNSAIGLSAYLPAQVHEILDHLVARGDHPRAGLKAALGEDQVGELLGEFDVGHLERACVELATAADAGRPHERLAGRVRTAELV